MTAPTTAPPEDYRVGWARKALAESKAADDSGRGQTALNRAMSHWGVTEGALEMALAAYDELEAERAELRRKVELLEEQAEAAAELRAERDRLAEQVQALTRAGKGPAEAEREAAPAPIEPPGQRQRGQNPGGGLPVPTSTVPPPSPLVAPSTFQAQETPAPAEDPRVIRTRRLLDESRDAEPPFDDVNAVAKWWSRMEGAVAVLLDVLDEQDAALIEAADELDRIGATS